MIVQASVSGRSAWDGRCCNRLPRSHGSPQGILRTAKIWVSSGWFRVLTQPLIMHVTIRQILSSPHLCYGQNVIYMGMKSALHRAKHCQRCGVAVTIMPGVVAFGITWSFPDFISLLRNPGIITSTPSTAAVITLRINMKGAFSTPFSPPFPQIQTIPWWDMRINS